MRAAIYTRISQDRAGLELGVTRQREDCRALARQRGWAVVAEHSDNDISASTGRRRPGYAALLAQVERGEVERVVVYMTSRLWRNRRERAEGIERFQRAGVGIVPVKGPELDFTSAMGRMVAGILGEVDTAEVEVKSERAKREVRQRAEQGRKHGGPQAYGIATDGHTLVESEATEIRRWYALILAGGSVSSIVRDTGRHHASVIAILRNPRNAGLRILDGETFAAPNPPIIPEATWRAVGAILDDPRRRHNQLGRSRRWLGAGIYVCACGHTVKTSYSGASDALARVYVCTRLRGGCGRSWRAEPIDEFVEGVVAERLGREDAADILAGLDDPADVGDLTTEAAGIRSRLAQLGAAFGNDDQADLTEFRTATQRLRERLTNIEAQMASVGDSGALAALLAAPDPQAAWRDLEDVERRKAIVQGLMVVKLLPSPRGRPSHTRSVATVVSIGWKV